MDIFDDFKVSGWLKTDNAKKRHYYMNGISLCRKWMLIDNRELSQEDHTDAPNCAICERRKK